MCCCCVWGLVWFFWGVVGEGVAWVGGGDDVCVFVVVGWGWGDWGVGGVCCCFVVLVVWLEGVVVIFVYVGLFVVWYCVGFV